MYMIGTEGVGGSKNPENILVPCRLGVGGTKMLAGTKLPMGTKSTFLSC